MGKSVLGREEQEKRSNVVKMPREDSGKEYPEEDGKGGQGAAIEEAEQSENEASKEGEKEQKPRKGARKALRGAVKKVVREDCGKFAERLVKNAEDGDTRCTAMMLSLMEKKDGEDNKPSDGPSLFDLLPSEPEWDEETEAKQEAEREEREAGLKVAA
jgi:hypothetical protein